MKCLRFVAVAIVFSFAGSAGLGDERSSPTVDGVLTDYERTVKELEEAAVSEIAVLRNDAVERLQKVQDRLCREALLDEAVAVREKIRSLRGEPPKYTGTVALPADAAEIVTGFESKVEAIELKMQRRIQTEGHGAAERLQPMFDRLCRDAQLDEALEVREVIRRLQGKEPIEVRPDPGYLSASAAQIGEVWYFEVTGANTGSCWGTDVYTTDSSLSAAAVHAGVLKIGEKGIVRVTILPGQASYPATTRNGITSSSWGSWGVSFKVERAYGTLHTKTVQIRIDSGRLNLSAADIGKVMYVELVGSADSAPYGTDVYTGDSWLPSAAVHSGALKLGEKGVVRVTVLPGLSDYPSSTRYGITSNHWGAYSVSYKVERVRGWATTFRNPAIDVTK